MSADDEDDRAKPPTGLFSGGSGKSRRSAEETKTPAGGMLIPGLALPSKEKPTGREGLEDAETVPAMPAVGAFDGPPEGADPARPRDERGRRSSVDLEPIDPDEDDVLVQIESPKSEAPTSSYPEPLGQAEGHDAWTLERMSRQSTVPPVRTDDVDRLRDMTAHPSRAPEVGGEALDLVDNSRPSQQLDLLGEMEELYALDDLTGALRFAELVLGRDPNSEQARRCAENCRSRLITLYTSKIGDMEGRPIQAIQESEVRWLGLDHRAGFLLSRVDGISTVEEVLDICGMPRLEALKTLSDLLDRGAIRLEP